MERWQRGVLSGKVQDNLRHTVVALTALFLFLQPTPGSCFFGVDCRVVGNNSSLVEYRTVEAQRGDLVRSAPFNNVLSRRALSKLCSLLI